MAKYIFVTGGVVSSLGKGLAAASTAMIIFPAEAAKVLYEIDFQYGQNKELCLSILARVFRGIQNVAQVLQEVGNQLA